MTPLLLTALLVLPWAAGRALGAAADRRRALAAWGLVLLFVFTGIGHFVAAEGMRAMLPSWTPAPGFVVAASGVLEIALGLAFAVPRWRRTCGIVAVAFLVFVFPLNVRSAWLGVGPGGHAWGPVYLLVRAPLQVLIGAWAYQFTVRRPATRNPPEAL